MALITKIKTVYSEVVAALGFTPENAANKGQPNGYAGLDAGGKVPSAQLPSYVDDVQEYANLAAFPNPGAAGIIYLALDTNIIYRWSGSTYIEIASGDVAWNDITGKPTFGTMSSQDANSVNITGGTANVTSSVIGNLSLATNQITSTQASDDILITPTGIGALKVQNRINLENTLSFGPLDPQGSYFANNAEYLQAGPLSAWSYLQNGTATKVEFDNGAAMSIFNAASGNAGDLILGWTEVLNISSAGNFVTGNWTAGIIDSNYGGTGVDNNGNTLTITANATISGTNTGDQTITLTGDVSGSGSGSFATTLANTTVTAGTYGNATQVPQITVDSKGRATSAGNVTITPAWSNVTGKPTTISGYGITDGVTLTGTQTLTNKTVTDATFTIQDDADNTKKAQFQASGITTATTRTYTLPNDNGKIVITNSGNTVNNIPKFNNDDKLVSSNITDDNVSVNIGLYAAFDLAGTTSISYINSYAISNMPSIGLITGSFAENNFYGGVYQSCLFSNDTTSQSVIVANPKIPYCVNGTNNYTGSKTGANIIFASDTTATNDWDIGIGANAVGVDVFSIGRNNTSLFTMNNAGAITTQIVSTRANNTGTGLGQIYLNGATGNRIDFNSNGTADPAFTTRSVGTKIVLYPNVSGSSVDYALGISSSTLWYSAPTTTSQHRFFTGTTSVARIRNDGIQTRANLYEGNAAFTVLNTTATLTIAQILTLVIQSTPTANITFTLPTGTNTDAGVMSTLETFASFTWAIVNIATGFTITMAGNTGNTYIGNTTIAANTSATFRTQKTAANTFKTVRI